MASCLLCNRQFPGTAPICAVCTAAQIAASAYRPTEEEQEEVSLVTDKTAAPQITALARAPFSELQPGEVVLDQFKVERKLGEGAFGAVYLVEQVTLSRKAVIKVVRPALSLNPTFMERFQREARVLASLDHHHLVKVFSFGELPTGQLFLAMEFGGERDLAQELRAQKRLELRRALRILSQVLEALQEAHARGIVHRDLKPANILLGRKAGEEWIKVVDVGIAKVIGERDELPEGVSPPGTPAYASPEQARGLAVDGRSDLYAAGIVLYEMLTGALPITGRTAVDFVRAHAMDAPTPTKQHGVSLPAAVEKILARALEKDPAKRFATAREMKAAVDAALAQVPAPRAPQAAARAKKSRFGWVAAGALLAAAAVAAGVALLVSDGGARPATRRHHRHVQVDESAEETAK